VRLGRQLYGVLIADARLVVTGKCVGVAAAVAAAGVRTRRGQGLGLGRVHGFWASWPGSRFRGGGEGIRPRSGFLTGTRAVPKVRLSAREQPAPPKRDGLFGDAGGSGGGLNLAPHEPRAATLALGHEVGLVHLVVLGLVERRLRVTIGGVPRRVGRLRGRGRGHRAAGPRVPDLGLDHVGSRRVPHVVDDRATVSNTVHQIGGAREGQRDRRTCPDE